MCLNRHAILPLTVLILQVTLVTALLCFVNPYTRMGGTELVYNLFAECRAGSQNTHSGLCVLNPPEQAMPVISAIGTAMLIKGGLTIVTFGIKLPAGIFIPSLGGKCVLCHILRPSSQIPLGCYHSVGACAGRILGILVQWMQYEYPSSPIFRSCNGDLNCVIPGLYAMVGAAATLSGVTVSSCLPLTVWYTDALLMLQRTTVSLAVIMFELTDTLTYAVPIMLSVLVAKTVADALEPKGIYDLVIEYVAVQIYSSHYTYTMYLDCRSCLTWTQSTIISGLSTR